MDPISEAVQSVLMGCQQKSWVHWWMERAGVGTVLRCLHIVGTKKCRFRPTSFFSLPQQHWEANPPSQKTNDARLKQISKIFCHVSAVQISGGVELHEGGEITPSHVTTCSWYQYILQAACGGLWIYQDVDDQGSYVPVFAWMLLPLGSGWIQAGGMGGGAGGS